MTKRQQKQQAIRQSLEVKRYQFFHKKYGKSKRIQPQDNKANTQTI